MSKVAEVSIDNITESVIYDLVGIWRNTIGDPMSDNLVLILYIQSLTILKPM